MERAQNIAVVGAGMAGLVLARHLQQAGIRVCVFDKGRSPGGRMCVRREGSLTLDHGAQYFTARDPRFRQQVQAWETAGLAARWKIRLVECDGRSISLRRDPTVRYVGTPAMNAVIHDMAQGLEVRTGTTVVDLARDHGAWQVKLGTGNSEGPFDAVVVTCPPTQAAALLVSSPSLVEETRAVRMEACWTVMAFFDESLELPFEAGFPLEGPLRWIARDSSKPGRSDAEGWILHATPKWSGEHIDMAPEDVVQALVAAFFKGVASKPHKPSFAKAHRWRHAQPIAPLRRGSLWDPVVRLGACGDWCESGRVEGAYLSGLHLAERILGQHSSLKAK